MTPVVSFHQTIVDAEGFIELSAGEASIQQALARGLGMLDGYYRAGGTSKVEYEGGAVYLRRCAATRASHVEFERAALRAGVENE